MFGTDLRTQIRRDEQVWFLRTSTSHEGANTVAVELALRLRLAREKCVCERVFVLMFQDRTCFSGHWPSAPKHTSAIPKSAISNFQANDARASSRSDANGMYLPRGPSTPRGHGVCMYEPRGCVHDVCVYECVCESVCLCLVFRVLEVAHRHPGKTRRQHSEEKRSHVLKSPHTCAHLTWPTYTGIPGRRGGTTET
jgi:hypothetical protein